MVGSKSKQIGHFVLTDEPIAVLLQKRVYQQLDFALSLTTARIRLPRGIGSAHRRQTGTSEGKHRSELRHWTA